MPAKRKKEQIAGRYFVWLLGIREGIYFADGRSNHPHQVGRHSLGTRDRQDALEQLQRLDLVKAVEFGLADRAVLSETKEKLLTLEEGKEMYLKYVQRTPVLGGAGKKTGKRYRAVFDKFIPFANQEGVRHWQGVSKGLLEAYTAWLDDQGYAVATEYLELTTLKQAMKWLAQEKQILPSCLFAMPLKKPKGTTTYCYTPEEVEAVVVLCFANPDLHWLGEVLVALATTGLRISELASLCWDDFNSDLTRIRLTDDKHRAIKAERDNARSTKSHCDRTLPVANELRAILAKATRHVDGRVFHGPLGGVLKPDTVRNILIREVLEPLSNRFRGAPGKKSFRDGRLHSLRHYFCSVSATNGVPEQMLMSWLGHQDSKMIRHYYHLQDKPSQEQMARIKFVGQPG
jgi:integrase